MQLRKKEYDKFDFIKRPTKGFNLTPFDGFQRLTMLDRYSLKDTSLETLKLGDVVLTIVKDHPTFPTMGYGKVAWLDGDSLGVEIDFPDSFEGQVIEKSLGEITKPLELYWEQIAYRVAKAIASVEKPEKQKEVFEDFYWMLSNLYYVPGGRIIYGAGNPANVTMFNCFVLGSIPDSRGGIIDHIKTATEIMSRGGGVGSCISTLRPRNASVLGVNGFSSGSVSWAHYLSELTHLISQAGSRRGAQMIGQHVWHPDIIEFILCKVQNHHLLAKLVDDYAGTSIARVAEAKLIRDESGTPIGVHNKEYMTGANISVLITDNFMDAVKDDKEWTLAFPDVANLTPKQKEIYDNEWESMGGLYNWIDRGLPIKEYETIPAKTLWELINTCARYSAEPGIIFIDRVNKEANSYYYVTIDIPNPCGEQMLPKFGTCNLGSINLSRLSQTGYFNTTDFERVVRISQRFNDNVIDATYHFLPEIEEMAKNERRIGKGVIGLADMMINLEVAYGSQEMIEITNALFEIMALVSYDESINLAIEKGSFPYLDKEKFIESGYMEKMPQSIKDRILEHGIRNVTSLTVAPTGSIGAMIGASSGLEPHFAFSYYRSGRMGEFVEIHAPIAQKYFDRNPKATELPEYFVCASDLTPEEHVAVQAAAQRWVDSSISKTVNADSDFTVEDNVNLYNLAYASGLKGITVYVDGSRDTQVLTKK